MPATVVRTPLDQLTEELDVAVRSAPRGRPDLALVCTALRPFLGGTGLLTQNQRIGDPDGYRTHVLHVADDGAYSLVALVWLPGQETPIHDHLSWCVVGVHEGAEWETRYRLTASGAALVETGTAHAGPGGVAALLPPGDIHRVRNDGGALAISLHVYGVD